MTAASLQGVGQPGGRAAGSLKAWQSQLTGYLYILPASILIFCFGLFPVGYALYMSTRRWRVVDRGYVGVENYLKAIGDPWSALLFAGGFLGLIGAWYLWTRPGSNRNPGYLVARIASLVVVAASLWLIPTGWAGMLSAGDDRFLNAIPITFYFAFGSIPVQLLVALCLAYILFQKIRGQEFFRMIFFLPYITPVIATALIFRNIFSPRELSIANRGMQAIGLPAQEWLFESERLLNLLFGTELGGFLAGPSLALVSIVFFGIWTYVGYNTVIFLAGLGSIDPTLYEAAEIDGASHIQQLRWITFPLLSPVTFYLSVIGFIGTFKAFNHIFVMMEPSALGTVTTVSINIFNTFNKANQFGYASAQAVLLLVVILYMTFVQSKVLGERVFYG